MAILRMFSRGAAPVEIAGGAAKGRSKILVRPARIGLGQKKDKFFEKIIKSQKV